MERPGAQYRHYWKDPDPVEAVAREVAMLAPVSPPLRLILHNAALTPGAKAALFAATLARVERELAAGGDPATLAHYRALRATARRLYEEFYVAARDPAG